MITLQQQNTEKEVFVSLTYVVIVINWAFDNIKIGTL